MFNAVALDLMVRLNLSIINDLLLHLRKKKTTTKNISTGDSIRDLFGMVSSRDQNWGVCYDPKIKGNQEVAFEGIIWQLENVHQTSTHQIILAKLQ